MILAGGQGRLPDGKEKDVSYLDTILEYNITGDSSQTGIMSKARIGHAISVVRYQDFSGWCQ